MNTIDELKNTLEGFSSRVEETKISNLEDKVVEITHTEWQKEVKLQKPGY